MIHNILKVIDAESPIVNFLGQSVCGLYVVLLTKQYFILKINYGR